MTTKKKNDNPNLLKRNALIISIAFNILLIAMFLLLYVPTLAPSLPPTQTPDSFMMTATQLIATASEAAIMTQQVITPVATLSNESETTLRAKFLSELETQLGFLHPTLEEIVGQYIDSIRYEIERHNETGSGATEIPENIIQDIDRTTFENIQYVAVVVPFARTEGATRGFIFRIENNTLEVLAQTDLNITLHPFEDRNGNGLPDVGFRWESCGSNCTYGMNIYEIRSNGEFVNLTEDLNAKLHNFVDLDGDGILELEGFQSLFVPDGSTISRQHYQWTPRWFFWNGEAYEPFPTFEGE
jgi:hypothetical protein